MKQLKVTRIYVDSKSDKVLGLRAQEVTEAGKVHHVQVPAASFKHLKSQPEVGGHIEVDGDFKYRKYKTGGFTKDKHAMENFKVIRPISQFEDEGYDEIPQDLPFEEPKKKTTRRSK